jgi:hypothetical protein
MKSSVNKILKKHPQLIHSDNMKVTSHVQRESGEWIINTIMIEDCAVPFKYKRKKRYKNLTGATVNLTYYPQPEVVAGIEFETMKVVRVRIS